VVADRGSTLAGHWRLRRRPLASRRLLVGSQSGERRAREFRIAFGYFAYQFEKQRKRTRCAFLGAFMLRCTMLR
jgi:hypothetical protein